MYTGSLVFEFKTNNYPAQNNYTLKDDQGNIIINRTGATTNFTYLDTAYLPTGCYSLFMKDLANDGLSFWNNGSQGSGWFKIKDGSGGTTLKTFNPDFGDNINYQFTVNYALPVAELSTEKPFMKIFLNPVMNNIVAEIHSARYSETEISLLNTMGQKVKRENIRLAQPVEKIILDVSLLSPGIYFLRMKLENFQDVQKIVVNK